MLNTNQSLPTGIQFLGCPDNATPAEVRSQWRMQLASYHPDKHQAKLAFTIFSQLINAYNNQTDFSHLLSSLLNDNHLRLNYLNAPDMKSFTLEATDQSSFFRLTLRDTFQLHIKPAQPINFPQLRNQLQSLGFTDTMMANFTSNPDGSYTIETTSSALVANILAYHYTPNFTQLLIVHLCSSIFETAYFITMIESLKLAQTSPDTIHTFNITPEEKGLFMHDYLPHHPNTQVFFDNVVINHPNSDFLMKLTHDRIMDMQDRTIRNKQLFYFLIQAGPSYQRELDLHLHTLCGLPGLDPAIPEVKLNQTTYTALSTMLAALTNNTPQTQPLTIDNLYLLATQIAAARLTNESHPNPRP